MIRFLLFVLLFSGCASSSKSPETVHVFLPEEELISRQSFDRYLDAQLWAESVGLKLVQGIGEKEKARHKPYFRLPILLLGYNQTIERIYSYQESQIFVGGILPGQLFPLTDVRRGDSVIALQSESVSTVKDFYQKLQKYQDEEDVLVRFRRKNMEWEEWVPLIKTSRPYPFFVDRRSHHVNASTDGERVIVTTLPMVLFVESEDQLAFILAHEMAHIELQHREIKKRQKAFANVVTMGIPSLIGSAISGLMVSDTEYYSNQGLISKRGGDAKWQAPFSRAQEIEADQKAMEYLRQSGFDANQGASILAKIAFDLSEMSSFSNTHPDVSLRYDLLTGVKQIEGDREPVEYVNESGPVRKNKEGAVIL